MENNSTYLTKIQNLRFLGIDSGLIFYWSSFKVNSPYFSVMNKTKDLLSSIYAMRFECRKFEILFIHPLVNILTMGFVASDEAVARQFFNQIASKIKFTNSGDDSLLLERGNIRRLSEPAKIYEYWEYSNKFMSLLGPTLLHGNLAPGLNPYPAHAPALFPSPNPEFVE